ncbi:hypothetical protein GQ56_0126185 [Burkholderia paludis]|nr:hypothetical protein GQ56_0126185 [Burkholderia paludis]
MKTNIQRAAHVRGACVPQAAALARRTSGACIRMGADGPTACIPVRVLPASIGRAPFVQDRANGNGYNGPYAGAVGTTTRGVPRRCNTRAKIGVSFHPSRP